MRNFSCDVYIKSIDENIIVAEYALTQSNLIGIAAYHLEQALAKLFKFAIFKKTGREYTTYNLRKLMYKVMDNGLEVPEEIKHNISMYARWENDCRYKYSKTPPAIVVQHTMNLIKQYYNYVIIGNTQTK